MMTDKSLAAVQELVAPIALQLTLDVESVEIRKTGNQKIVKVILDKDGGISLEEIAAATREISVKLDELAELASSFTLEVTSPGVDRPLTAPKHWRRNLGR
ncbi:MAG: ribosome maturation factor RimP, partial [Candidatus Nanopelagicales bacterium]